MDEQSGESSSFRPGAIAPARAQLGIPFLSTPAQLFWGAALIYCAWGRGCIDVQDAQIRYLVANRIWDAGSIHLTAEQADSIPGWLPRLASGEGVSFYGLGQSLTMLPAVIAADLATRALPEPRRSELRYLIAQFIYMTAFLPLCAALGIVFYFRLARRMGLEQRHALWSAVAFGFATPWLYYAKSSFLEVEVIAWFLAGLVFYPASGASSRRLVASALCFGATFHYRQEFLIPVALTAAVLFVRAVRRGDASLRSCAAFIGPILALGSLVLLHNYARSGSVLASMPGELPEWHEPMLAAYPGENLAFIWLGVEKGLLWYCPVLGAAMLLLLPSGRRWSPSFLPAALPLGAFVLFVASLNWSRTEGGWGPRYLLPAVPFVMLALSWSLAPLAARARGRAALALLIGAASAVQFAIAFEPHYTPVEQTRRVNESLAGRGDGVRIDGWRRSMLLGRLRNLGVPVGDPPEVARAWRSVEVQHLRLPAGENLWWLKLGRKLGGGGVGVAIAVLGAVLAVAGAALICAGLLRGARLRPSRRIPGALGERGAEFAGLP